MHAHSTDKGWREMSNQCRPYRNYMTDYDQPDKPNRPYF